MTDGAPFPNLRTQLFRFVVVGVIATCVDAGLYFAEIRLLGMDYDVSKAISFLFGTTVSFLLNRAWTFEASNADHTATRRFLVLYAVTFLLNVAVNRLVLWTLLPTGLSKDLVEPTAVVVATACSTITNFIGQKLWVFAGVSPPQRP